MLATVERSGVIEQIHDGAVAVVDRNGELVAATGDIDRPFFIRSSAKPFQAWVSLRHAPHLAPVQRALACSSHTAEPIHVAVVSDVLAGHGLDESDLRCPPARPVGVADRRLAAGGDLAPARRYHNCSGKHAAMLAACVTSGWDTATYLEPDHPLQREIRDVIADVSKYPIGPAGIDGCGAPVWQTTTRALAGAFARLETDPAFAEIRQVMARYPLLVSGSNRVDGTLARSLGGVAKGGAAGCLGLSVGGVGIGVKAWDGSTAVTGVGAAIALEHLGLITESIGSAIDSIASPPVFGGGEMVGRIRPATTLVVA